MPDIKKAASEQKNLSDSEESSNEAQANTPIESSLTMEEAFEAATIDSEDEKVPETPKMTKPFTKLDSYDKFTSNLSIDGVKLRARPSSCVFVASLSINKSEKELDEAVSELFKKWGNACVKVLRDEKQRPYSFVQYTDDADAKKALKEAQGCYIFDRPIRCEPARINRTIYLFNKMGVELSYDSATKMASKFGELEMVIASNDKLDHLEFQPRPGHKAPGWFIQYVYRDEAICAFLHFLDSLTVDVQWVQNIQLPTDSSLLIDKSSVYVGHLSPVVTEALLTERFSAHGDIKSVSLIQKSSSPFAFISFHNEVSAARAVERENHAIFLNKTMHVQYKEIHPKENRTMGKNSREPRLVIAHPPVGTNSKFQLNRKRYSNSLEFQTKGFRSRSGSAYMSHPVPGFFGSDRERQSKGLKQTYASVAYTATKTKSSPTSSPSSKSNYLAHPTNRSESVYSASLADETATEDTEHGSHTEGKSYFEADFMPRALPLPNTPYFPYAAGYKGLAPPPPPPKNSAFYGYSPYNYYFGDGMGYMPPLPPPQSHGPGSPYYMYFLGPGPHLHPMPMEKYESNEMLPMAMDREQEDAGAIQEGNC